MKKLTNVLMFALGVSLLFTACNKDDEDGDDDTNTVPASTLGTATITGRALANLDLSNDTTTATDGNAVDSTRYENVPSGTTLYATIDTDELIINPAAGTDGANRIYTTTVDGGGNYTFTVDANVKEVNVTLTSDDFIFSQVQPGKGGLKIQQNYFLNEDDITVTKGQKKNRILYFDNEQLID